MENKTGTKEWSDISFNCISGCSHDCRYCYAKAMANRFKQRKGDWKDEVKVNNIGKATRKYNGVVMFPTSHDITEGNHRHCLGTLITLLHSGNNVLVVSKMSAFVANKIVELPKEFLLNYKDQLEFRITVSSTMKAIGKYFEPGAPYSVDRLSALGKLQKCGFKTSLSMEPMLIHPDDTIEWLNRLDLCNKLDSIWLGCMNWYKLDPNIHEEKLVLDLYKPENLKAIYDKYKIDPRVRFKHSFLKKAGLK